MSESPSSPSNSLLPLPATDLTPPLLTEDALAEILTHYVAYTIRKHISEAPGKLTWARAAVAREHLYQDEIKLQIQKLNDSDIEHGRTLQSKTAALFPFQKGQVNALLDDLSRAELDMNFEWTLAQLDREERHIGHGMRETETMTVFVKRCPVKDVDQTAVHEALQIYAGDPTALSMYVSGRRNSLHISDVAPFSESTSPKPSTEEGCRKALKSHYISIVSTTIMKGQLSFDLTNLQIEYDRLVKREKMRDMLQEINIRTRQLFSLDYRRKPLNAVEQLLILSFLKHQRDSEEDENFEWAIVKAFKHRGNDQPQVEPGSGTEKILVQIFSKRELKQGRSAIKVMYAKETLDEEEGSRRWETSLPLAILPDLQQTMTPDANIITSPARHSPFLQLPLQIQMEGAGGDSLAPLVPPDESSSWTSTNSMISSSSRGGTQETAEDTTALVLRAVVPDNPSQTNSSPKGPDMWWTWMKDSGSATPPGRTRAGQPGSRPFNQRRHPLPEITSIECWIFDDSQAPQLKTYPIMNYWVLEWAAIPTPIRNESEPKSGLKLIHRRVSHDQRPFSEATFTGLNKLLSIPPIYEHRMSSKTGLLARVSSADGGIVFICKKAASSATISAVLSYTPATNITTGYILSGDGIDPIQSLLPSFAEQYASCPHPILILILIMEIMVDNISSNLESVEDNLRNVEQTTGYSNQTHRLSNSMVNLNDYRELAKSLGAQTCRFVLIKSLIENVTMLSGFIQDQLICPPYVTSPDGKDITDLLLERSNITKSTLLHMQTYGAIEGRLQAQQNVLFNLISQQDNSLNIEVARDSKEIAAASKRDSSAMKVIAVLTTLFLPGAFIATLLSMPLLDWSSTSVITSHFWVYWAIAIPLTLITMLAVALWIFIQAKHNEAMVKAARDAVAKDASSYAPSSLWYSTDSEIKHGFSTLMRNIGFRWGLWWSYQRKRWHYGSSRSFSTGSGSGSLVDD